MSKTDPHPDEDRSASQELLLLGRVGRAKGLRGELFLRLFNADTTLLVPGRALFVRHGDGATGRNAGGTGGWLSVRRARREPKGWVVRIDGVDDRDAAEALRGAEVFVSWSELPPVEDDEFYYEELRGFAVIAADGRRVGEVAGLFETSADMLVVRDGRRELYIPVLDGFVTSIDRERRVIEVDPPEGLLDPE